MSVAFPEPKVPKGLLMMLVKENRLTLLSKIDDVSKKQNDKKSKRIVAAPAAV